MNRNRNYRPSTDDADDNNKDKKIENVRILQSSTCRRLFWGANDPIPSELSKEAREEQKLRWNFDFMTETPLPGRYQWERTGDGGRNGTADRKRSRSPTETQCPRPEKQRIEASRSDEISSTQSPSDRLQATYGVDCT